MKCLICKSKMVLIETKTDALIKCTNCTMTMRGPNKEATIDYFKNERQPGVKNDRLH